MTRSTDDQRRRGSPWLVVLPVLVFSTAAVYVSIQRHAATSREALAHGPVTHIADVYSKFHRVGARQYLWAKGPKVFDDEHSEWFDMTGSPLTLETINHGIGRDTIASIDDPVFVSPDDPRLALKWRQIVREDVNRLRVIGFAHGGEARAYPIALLNHHELVNDTVGGKPVTVGW